MKARAIFNLRKLFDGERIFESYYSYVNFSILRLTLCSILPYRKRGLAVKLLRSPFCLILCSILGKDFFWLGSTYSFIVFPSSNDINGRYRNYFSPFFVRKRSWTIMPKSLQCFLHPERMTCFSQLPSLPFGFFL